MGVAALVTIPSSHKEATYIPGGSSRLTYSLFATHCPAATGPESASRASADAIKSIVWDLSVWSHAWLPGKVIQRGMPSIQMLPTPFYSPCYYLGQFASSTILRSRRLIGVFDPEDDELSITIPRLSVFEPHESQSLSILVVRCTGTFRCQMRKLTLDYPHKTNG